MNLHDLNKMTNTPDAISFVHYLKDRFPEWEWDASHDDQVFWYTPVIRYGETDDDGYPVEEQETHWEELTRDMVDMYKEDWRAEYGMTNDRPTMDIIHRILGGPNPGNPL